MRARHGVISDADQLRVTCATQRDRSLAVLNRLLGVELRQRARRLWNRAEVARDRRKRGVGRKAAGDNQNGVVRLVIRAVERLQTGDVDVLDVGARADRRLAVVVPIIFCRAETLQQHLERAVLAAFHLVAHDGHLAVEIGAGDFRVHHPVRFHCERPIEVLIRCIERFVVVRAVVPGGPVVLHAALAHRVDETSGCRCSFEHQMLEQVRHAGLAVVLVTRADEIRDVHRGLGLACIRKQQHLEAVRERVFTDALDARALRHTSG